MYIPFRIKFEVVTRLQSSEKADVILWHRDKLIVIQVMQSELFEPTMEMQLAKFISHENHHILSGV